jgi:hypothetical protein
MLPAVVALLLVVIVSVAGCYEVKDRPEEGTFIITLETPLLFKVDTGGDTLLGPEAEVETELHHKEAHPGWDLDRDGHVDLHEQEAHYEGGEAGIQPVDYVLEFYEHEEPFGTFLAVTPSDRTVAAVADLFYAEHPSADEVANHTPLAILSNFTLFQRGPEGAVLNSTELALGAIEFNMTLEEVAEKSTKYVVGFWPGPLASGEDVEIALRIYPGEHHLLRREPGGNLHLTISNATDVIFNGALEEAPAAYHTEMGAYHWEGEIGEEEEIPGPGAVAALSAVLVAVVSLSRRRRSLMR